MSSQKQTDEPKRRFLTIEQVAEELSVGQPLVRSLLRTGELRGIQIGGRGIWRVAATDVEDYITQAYKITAERIAAGEIPDDEGESV
ncbi:helix-turn-helix domain-containing protein [Pseudarthrobacter sulfonivorans]|uniref:helix-turn-helix domain-containing protein n=1 Tax=Pseudarthrobacter sulfonivorans TaxID=121292 RepID=UPI00285C011B|nr:helix-turn-helix domain-containing protein [Pseudarthrobacter sulfonivorans]MDR6417581.1 excisionase family DNA binding protein [Pseudarthrobacter sulfonivorans]